MALNRGCHRIAKGNQAEAKKIAPLILQHGLLVRQAWRGVAAYAYYIEMVLDYYANDPLVVFDVEERFVQRVPLPQRRPDFAIMMMPGAEGTYIPITVQGFVNLPGFPPYQGRIGFV